MLVLPPVRFRVSEPHLSIAVKGAPERAPGARRRVGGKAPAKTLLRPVNASSKRGRVLRHFIEGSGGVRDAMTLFGLSRQGVFANWTRIRHYHGIGYSFDPDADVIAARLPEGATAPWGDDHGA